MNKEGRTPWGGGWYWSCRELSLERLPPASASGGGAAWFERTQKPIQINQSWVLLVASSAERLPLRGEFPVCAPALHVFIWFGVCRRPSTFAHLCASLPSTEAPRAQGRGTWRGGPPPKLAGGACRPQVVAGSRSHVQEAPCPVKHHLGVWNRVRVLARLRVLDRCPHLSEPHFAHLRSVVLIQFSDRGMRPRSARWLPRLTCRTFVKLPASCMTHGGYLRDGDGC